MKYRDVAFRRLQEDSGFQKKKKFYQQHTHFLKVHFPFLVLWTMNVPKELETWPVSMLLLVHKGNKMILPIR